MDVSSKLPVIHGSPVVNQISLPREKLPTAYAECLKNNPLLGRIEGAAKTIQWSDLEIRTLQLLTAVQSNASLQQRLRELEQSLGKRIE